MRGARESAIWGFCGQRWEDFRDFGAARFRFGEKGVEPLPGSTPSIRFFLLGRGAPGAGVKLRLRGLPALSLAGIAGRTAGLADIERAGIVTEHIETGGQPRARFPATQVCPRRGRGRSWNRRRCSMKSRKVEGEKRRSRGCELRRGPGTRSQHREHEPHNQRVQNGSDHSAPPTVRVRRAKAGAGVGWFGSNSDSSRVRSHDSNGV